MSVARAAAGAQMTRDPRFRRAGGEANEVAVSVARAAAGAQMARDPRFRRAGGEANEVAS
ncbi:MULTISPECIES: hypothetical protein [Streptomyces]|uniref:Uncharacterized protein n=1 Tax=Streptomyces melanosporofaciens TaxID=67327 RepID=A0A1H4LSQ6_STRMJ|nr:hypothetical protein [Streptomyces melanosporofaciens]SEB73232.1 hypothetical protein SAMN04490356_1466 [Streptomyces melanosporofaciens]